MNKKCSQDSVSTIGLVQQLQVNSNLRYQSVINRGDFVFQGVEEYPVIVQRMKFLFDFFDDWGRNVVLREQQSVVNHSQFCYEEKKRLIKDREKNLKKMEEELGSLRAQFKAMSSNSTEAKNIYQSSEQFQKSHRHEYKEQQNEKQNQQQQQSSQQINAPQLTKSEKQQSEQNYMNEMNKRNEYLDARFESLMHRENNADQLQAVNHEKMLEIEESRKVVKQQRSVFQRIQEELHLKQKNLNEELELTKEQLKVIEGNIAQLPVKQVLSNQNEVGSRMNILLGEEEKAIGLENDLIQQILRISNEKFQQSVRNSQQSSNKNIVNEFEQAPISNSRSLQSLKSSMILQNVKTNIVNCDITSKQKEYGNNNPSQSLSQFEQIQTSQILDFNYPNGLRGSNIRSKSITRLSCNLENGNPICDVESLAALKPWSMSQSNLINKENSKSLSQVSGLINDIELQQKDRHETTESIYINPKRSSILFENGKLQKNEVCISQETKQDEIKVIKSKDKENQLILVNQDEYLQQSIAMPFEVFQSKERNNSLGNSQIKPSEGSAAITLRRSSYDGINGKETYKKNKYENKFVSGDRMLPLVCNMKKCVPLRTDSEKTFSFGDPSFDKGIFEKQQNIQKTSIIKGATDTNYISFRIPYCPPTFVIENQGQSNQR